MGVLDAAVLGWRYRWLRFYREDGSLVPTNAELAEAERQRAEQAEQRAEQERLLREQAERRIEQERLMREQAERRLAELEAELKRLRGEP